MGCATARTPEQYARLANTMSSPALCYIEYAGDNNDKNYSRIELSRRNFVCQPQDIENGRQEVGQIQDRKASSDAATRALQMELGLRLLQPPAPPPRPVTCYTNPYGYTTCY